MELLCDSRLRHSNLTEKLPKKPYSRIGKPSSSPSIPRRRSNFDERDKTRLGGPEVCTGSNQDNRSVIIEAIWQSGCALKYASKSLQADRPLVMAAVKQDGRALAHAAAELRADEDIVLLACEGCDGDAFFYADMELKVLSSSFDRTAVWKGFRFAYSPFATN